MPRAPRIVAQGDSTREAIFAAAVHNFGRFGYRGTSLARIAADAGIVQSAILHHFSTKEKLLLATLERFYDEHGTLRDPEGRGIDEMPVPDYLELAAATNERRADLVRFYAVLSAESTTEEHPAQEFFRARFAQMRGHLTDKIQAEWGGALSPERARDLVTLAVAALDGLQTQWILEPRVAMTSCVALLRRVLSPADSGDSGDSRAG